MLQILESGMTFGYFEPEQVFRIENSLLHNQIGSGVKCVEFILLKKPDKLLFVEAKSSSPKAETSWDRYNEFLSEITDKFVHSFDMLSALQYRRLDDQNQAGSDIKNITYESICFVFILVVNGHKEAWLLPLQEELNRKLRYHRSIWKSRVIVLNEKIAKKYNLVL